MVEWDLFWLRVAWSSDWKVSHARGNHTRSSSSAERIFSISMSIRSADAFGYLAPNWPEIDAGECLWDTACLSARMAPGPGAPGKCDWSRDRRHDDFSLGVRFLSVDWIMSRCSARSFEISFVERCDQHILDADSSTDAQRTEQSASGQSFESISLHHSSVSPSETDY